MSIEPGRTSRTNVFTRNGHRSLHDRQRIKRRDNTCAGEKTSRAPIQDKPGDEPGKLDGPKQSKTLESILESKGRARKRERKTLTASLGYDVESRRPIVCLAFVLPLLIFYEIGSIWIGNDAFRSGIDQWLHSALSQFGLGQLVVLPLVTIGVLIAWHHRCNDHWRVRPQVLLGMLVEAAGLGLILFFAAKSISLMAGYSVGSTSDGTLSSWELAVAYVGSGIYEELLFRIVLLVPIVCWARSMLNNQRAAMIVGVLIVSLLFAAAHYSILNPAGSEFELSSFAFRFFASIAFCLLFLFRGFGIAVGAHVAYDLLTQF